MEKIIFHPEARKELLDASVYYEGCREGLGQEFLAAPGALDKGEFIRVPVRRLPSM